VQSRSLLAPDLRAFVLPFALLVPVAADSGGYWPTSWGWVTLVLCWVGALVLVVGGTIRFTAWEAIAAVGLWLLLGWTLLSASWGSSTGRSLTEGERTVVYATALLTALLLVRRRSYPALFIGIWGATPLVSAYALATRLFPERLGSFDPIAGYRLSEPIGYWNALGIFAALGAILAVGLAARARSLLVVGLAAASLPLLVATLYFTFSRGAWIAFAAGLVGAVLLDARRLQFVTALFVLSPGVVAGLALAYSSDALTNRGAALASASREGHRMALVLATLGVANGLLALLLRQVEGRLAVPVAARRAYGIGLLGVLAAALVLAFAHWGSPSSLARRAYDSFAGPPVQADTNLNRRLFNLSGNGRLPQWRVAWHQYEAHALLGSGAGTYELAWNQRRPYAAQVRDAHNLYLEMLAELGPVGLVLLVVALAAPAIAAIRARRHALVPVAFGAYAAFLVHAVVDWDWEIPAITLAGIFCGAGLLVAGRSLEGTRELVRPARAAALALVIIVAGFGLVGLIGNRAVAAAGHAADSGNWRKVEARATTASRWAPWSAKPWQLRAEAQLADGRDAAAVADFRKAIAEDPQDWTLWFGLAQASSSHSRRVALARALRLNPRSPEIAEYMAANGIRKVRP
jgi:O-Antigen ligase